MVPPNWSSTTSNRGRWYGARWVRRMRSSTSALLRGAGPDAVEQRVGDLVRSEPGGAGGARVARAEHQRAQQRRRRLGVHGELVAVRGEDPGEHLLEPLVGGREHLPR